jgi:hypothetical protein
MKLHWLIRLAQVLVSVFALGQAPQAKPKDKAPDPPIPHSLPLGITLSEPAFLFPVEERGKVRDIQFEYDQLEIDSQRMLVKIEQNKARQAALMDTLKQAAFSFAQAKHIDLERYELDPKDIKFVKKKSAAVQPSP